MSEPAAVLISDIHFSPATLELASQSLLKAQFKAKMLDVPLIIAGDLLDTKAIIRAECANKLLQMLSVKDKTDTYILVGNHDLVNEKGTEHALNFLWGFAEIIDKPTEIDLSFGHVMLLPYYSDSEALSKQLQAIKEDEDAPRTLIMHQGVQSAFMGHYVQDRTSLPKEAFADFRVISGHYHRHQDIKCGRPRKGGIGLFSYIGNPYTLNFGEANDGPKGYCILMDDGTLQQVPLNLRKHVIREWTIGEPQDQTPLEPGDLLWIKVTGPQSELAKLKKAEIGKRLLGHSNFKLDLIPTDSKPLEVKTERLTGEELFDKIIDNTGETEEQKQTLKNLWRELVK